VVSYVRFDELHYHFVVEDPPPTPTTRYIKLCILIVDCT
jgi:hypothetical protein